MSNHPIRKVLIANRGEIACRIIKTCRRMGIQTVAVYSSIDAQAVHVQQADQAVYIGDPEPKSSYLNISKLITAAIKTGAQAIHPGYGFLSENPDFARACTSAGIVFIGPSVEAIEAMGSKSAAKAIMQEANVPLVPGYNGQDQSEDVLLEQAHKIGFPLLIKASAGGGGRGIRVVHGTEEFSSALSSCKREAMSSFANDHVLLERYLTMARHIEVQVFGDTRGQVVHLFERDCSMQRRHQKVIEEAPAPRLSSEQRQEIGSIAVKAAKAIGYVGAGTVEFIAETTPQGDVEAFYFMEMNTRLQVEHPVTEMITGLDLVEWQIRVAQGEPLPLQQQQIQLKGHAIEVRVCAEDPNREFIPSTGKIEVMNLPAAIVNHLRIDNGIRQGDSISPYYDSMMFKIISWSETREGAIAQMRDALVASQISGPSTNLKFLHRLLGLSAFQNSELSTGLIETQKETLIGSRPLQESDIILATAAALTSGPLSQHFNLSEPSWHRSMRHPADPWATHKSWRVAQPATREITFCRENEEISLSLQFEPPLLGLQGKVLPLRIQQDSQPGHIFAQWGEQSIQGSAHWHIHAPYRVTIQSPAGDVTLELQNPFLPVSQHHEQDASLTSPMPGEVTRVSCTPGSQVSKGQTLIVISAMKMEFIVAAPHDGTVEEVFCVEGDLVAEGAVLVTVL